MKPLRELNEKIIEILKEIGSQELNEETKSSADIENLYKVFGNLILDWQFSKNIFLQRKDHEDILSIMDLANTCQVYLKVGNYRAAGVCYNNIANLHLKNGKYDIAEENYLNAIECVQKCLHNQK